MSEKFSTGRKTNSQPNPIISYCRVTAKLHFKFSSPGDWPKNAEPREWYVQSYIVLDDIEDVEKESNALCKTDTPTFSNEF